jgi:protein-L-isoaspartate(D-aspartate) O-methyltransferase
MSQPPHQTTEQTQADSLVRQRRAMVEEQLLQRGITDQRVLQAMLSVPREQFVPDELVAVAYHDAAQAIGCDQTISQPFTVAFMMAAARLTGVEKVLEIGTGSGYGAAVLSRLADRVYTVERIEPLAEAAASKLAELGYDNVEVFFGDGSKGLADYAPYDAIIVTAAASELPVAYREQLADGGRIIIPIDDPAGAQTMYRYTRDGDTFQVDDLGKFAFVRLIGN